MIHVLDANALMYLEAQRLPVPRKLQAYVPDEIKDEFLSNPRSEAWFEKSEFVKLRIDEAEYLTEYARILNDYPDVSFYKLKGFGDVAILASVGLLVRQLAPDELLFADLLFEDVIAIVSGDGRLRDYAADWLGKKVTLRTPEEFAAIVRS